MTAPPTEQVAGPECMDTLGGDFRMNRTQQCLGYGVRGTGVSGMIC